MSMPEAFYGLNRLFIINHAASLIYEFDPKEAVSLSAFIKRDKYFKDPKKKEGDEGATQGAEKEVDEDVRINSVCFLPKAMEVKQAYLWKKKDLSKVKDFNQIEIISDWTYSTPYRGSIRVLNQAVVDRIWKETSLTMEAGKGERKEQIVTKETEECIPVERLGRDNPIITYAEVFLYEDDLGDQGYAQCSIRYRVMADCFFILHRFYLRIDEVNVRILDTRIFHSFDKNEFLREFQHKECTFEELRAKGCKLNSEWSLSKTQSDEIFADLTLKYKYLDKVTF